MDGLDQWFLTFYESKIHLRVWLFPPLQPLKLKDGFSSEEKLWQSRQCIKKQIHYFADKGLYSQSYGFPVVMYGCESWTVKKAEHQRIDAFELWW